jgi:YVTN family beta-propeller protein
MAGGDNGVVVVPYSSSHSDLFRHVNVDTTLGPVSSPHMPTDQETLPRQQILLLKRWIDEGAKNDAGEVALAGVDRRRVFVTAQAEDKVTAIDLETGRPMRYIGVGSRPDSSTPPEAPHNITLSPDGNYFYLNLIAAGMIEKYDARTFQKLGQTEVGLSPAQIAVTRDGSTLYVSNFDLTLQQTFIDRVDAATMKVTATISDVGLAPHGVTLSADERYLYTTNAGGDDVSEIDLQSPDFEVTRRIPIVPGSPKGPADTTKYEPYQSVLSPDGGLLFVSCRESGEVRVIDLGSGMVIDSIKVGSRPLILNITPDGREIWVPNQGSVDLSIIDVATRRVTATVTGLDRQPHGVTFTADGKTAFVSCENQSGHEHHPTIAAKIPGKVYVVSVATRSVERTIEVGAFAAGIVVGK